MGIKQLYNDNLRKLPNECGDVSVMFSTILDFILLYHLYHSVMYVTFRVWLQNSLGGVYDHLADSLLGLKHLLIFKLQTKNK